MGTWTKSVTAASVHPHCLLAKPAVGQRARRRLLPSPLSPPSPGLEVILTCSIPASSGPGCTKTRWGQRADTVAVEEESEGKENCSPSPSAFSPSSRPAPSQSGRQPSQCPLLLSSLMPSPSLMTAAAPPVSVLMKSHRCRWRSPYPAGFSDFFPSSSAETQDMLTVEYF